MVVVYVCEKSGVGPQGGVSTHENIYFRNHNNLVKKKNIHKFVLTPLVVVLLDMEDQWPTNFS